MQFRYRNLSIRWKFLIPTLSLFLGLILVGQATTSLVLKEKIKTRVDEQLTSNTGTLHNLILSIAKSSLRGYMRGIVEEATTNLTYMAANRAADRPLESLKAEAAEMLGKRSIGPSGYIYCIDSSGVIQVHPEGELIDKEVAYFTFVRRQMEMREGYLEYRWQNPGEKELRTKALYMTYFPEWDWIVTASAYRDEFEDLVDIDEMEADILQARFGTSGYSFLLGTDGSILVHPTEKGGNLKTLGTDPALNAILNPEDGADTIQTLEYNWAEEGKTERRKRTVFRRIPEFDWIIGSSVYLDDIYSPVDTMRLLTILTDIITLGLMSLLMIRLSYSVSRPITELAGYLQKSLELGPGDDGKDRDEIHTLTRSFERFLIKLDKAQSDIRLLARFPDESPAPVIRIDDKRNMTYQNQPAEQKIAPYWGRVGTQLPREISELLPRDEHNPAPLSWEIGDQLFQISLTPLKEERELYLYFQNVTTLKNYETLMLMSDNLFRNSIEGIAITDGEGRILQINDSFCRITGYSREEALGQNTRLLKSDRHPRSFYKEMWDRLLSTGSWEGEIWNRRKNGEAYPQHLSISSYQDNRTGELRYLSLFHDTTDIKKQEELLNWMNSYDPLTELPNRSLFRERLDRALKFDQREKNTGAVLLLNLDGFKNINDSLGHSRGDLFLQKVAGRLTGNLRDADTVARIASDEFAVLLPHLNSKEEGLEVIRRIQRDFSESIYIGGKALIPSLSCGALFFPDDGTSVDEILKNADIALNRTKKERRGGFSLFDVEQDSAALRRTGMELDLREGLKRKEFFLLYQPKQDLATGGISGFEALLRWNRKGGEVVSPLDFIPLLEKSGLIIPVGSWVIREACRFWKELKQRGRQDIKVAVNISVSQFKDPRFRTNLLAILNEEQVPPEALELELTENISATEIPGAIEMTTWLTVQGFSVAIDDFGTGYSSLNYLKDFAFSTLKIDKSFIDNVPGDENSHFIITAIISLGQSLLKNTIAEGVETEKQLNYLKSLGCHQIQGYLFSRPLAPADALAFLDHAKTEDTP